MYTTPSRHGPGGYRGAMRAAARQQFTRQRNEVVNSNIILEPATETPQQPSRPISTNAATQEACHVSRSTA